MNPDNFRKDRVEIDDIIEGIEMQLKNKSILEAKKYLDKAAKLVDKLSSQKEGEIQKRSVKNLRYRVEYLTGEFSKAALKVKPAKKTRKKPMAELSPS